jgi:hypothetical protein
MEARQEEILSEIRAGRLKPDAGEEKIRRTRAEVTDGWTVLAANLRATGEHELADGIRIFTGSMPPPQTEKARIAVRILKQFRETVRGSRVELTARKPEASREHTR